MDLNKIIYFAGPDVFRQNPENWFDLCSIYVEKFGINAIFPIDNYHDTSKNNKDDSKLIYKINISKIDNCTHVLANLQPFRGVSADAGTCFEIGYAKAKGKVVYGYYNGWLPVNYKNRSTEYKEMLDRNLISFNNENIYPQIEDFSLVDNLMIAHGCDRIFTSMQEAVTAVVLSNKTN